MTIRSCIRKTFESRRPRTFRTAAARRRLTLEALEDRAVPTVSFGPAVAYGTGGPSPQTVVTSDFNHDGRLDLVTIEPSSESISVLTGNGNGSFGLTGGGVSTGFNNNSLVVGDFNGDQVPDVATVTPTNGGDVGVFLGSPAGLNFATFNQGIGTGATFGAAGDFNGDGKVDLAVAYHDASTVSVVLGNGDGTFQVPAVSTASTGSLPVAVAVGDFNGDGKLDVVTANSANSDRERAARQRQRHLPNRRLLRRG